jgi:hypothetical protein
MTKRNPSYKKPEYEFKEFYRVFKNYPELLDLLPEGIDKEIFKVKGNGFGGEPEWLEKHVDPPSRPDEINTEELLRIASEEDPRFIPFILWCLELFSAGKMEMVPLDYMRPRLTSDFKNHDWDVLEKDPDYLNSCKIEYAKAIKAGLSEDRLTKETGLVQKYPDIAISKAQFWAYIKGSIDYFDRIEKSGEKLPCTQFILHDGNYYTVGGRRRMFWHFYNQVDPTVWLMKL